MGEGEKAGDPYLFLSLQMDLTEFLPLDVTRLAALHKNSKKEKTMKSTKRAFLTSVMALLLCFTMLLGTTFAWFTDTASSEGNKIVAGTLDVKLLLYKDGAYTDISENSDPIFGDGAIAEDSLNTKWEPGKTQVAYLAIENAGNLDLKYEVVLTVKDDSAQKLYEVMQYAITPDAMGTDANAPAWDAANGLAVIEGAQTVTADDVTLGAKQTHYFALSLHMLAEAGNDYQGGEISFDITVRASQLASEKDSFGNQYDKDATYPELNTVDTWDGTASIDWFLADPQATTFTLGTAEDLAGLAAILDGTAAIPSTVADALGEEFSFADKEIILESDLDLYQEDENGNRINFNPIGHSGDGKAFNGVFDGQGHTIKNLYIQNDLGAWQYDGEYYALFAYTNGATIKNVTIADAYISSGKNEAAGVVGNAVDTTFSDITISNTTLIAYNNSAGGVAAECYGNCSFTNITVDEDTVIGPLWGTYDVRLGGVVGLVHAGNNVTFSNITVACQLDAINDVAANYQYWSYRYSGMLIGHVDGVNGVADPTGYVTCENVTVIYGDWVNYHYCEDADLGAGSYNGPGEYKYSRVEAGTGTDGIDLSACNHNDDESHNVLIVFDQLFGGGQGVSGLAAYDGVTVTYNNK